MSSSILGGNKIKIIHDDDNDENGNDDGNDGNYNGNATDEMMIITMKK